MSKTIIALLGGKGAGKDTAAHNLIASGKYKQLAFGDAIKQELAQLFRLDVEVFYDRSIKETAMIELSLNKIDDKDYYAVAFAHVSRLKRYPFFADAVTLEDAFKQDPQNDPRLKALSEEHIRLMRSEGYSHREQGGGYGVSAMTNQFYLSPRLAMQLYGTEYRRKFKGDNLYFVNIVEQEILTSSNSKFLVTDVRDPAEVEMLKRLGAITVRIEREDNPHKSEGTGGHSSETQVDSLPYDYLICNCKGTLELQDELETLTETLENLNAQR